MQLRDKLRADGSNGGVKSVRMKTLQALLLALLLLPCNAADKAKKLETQLSQQNVSAHSIDEAIASAKPPALVPGKKVKRPITLKNPVLEIEGQRVAYDVYSMQGSDRNQIGRQARGRPHASALPDHNHG